MFPLARSGTVAIVGRGCGRRGCSSAPTSSTTATATYNSARRHALSTTAGGSKISSSIIKGFINTTANTRIITTSPTASSSNTTTRASNVIKTTRNAATTSKAAANNFSQKQTARMNNVSSANIRLSVGKPSTRTTTNAAKSTFLNSTSGTIRTQFRLTTPLVVNTFMDQYNAYHTAAAAANNNLIPKLVLRPSVDGCEEDEEIAENDEDGM